MQPLVFFLLGQKGYEVLRAVSAGSHKDKVRLVVIGSDANVQKDYFDEIESLCRERNIRYCTRGDVPGIQDNVDGAIAIAAGWRWLIKHEFIQVIVFHDSLLPKYRGYNPLVTALLNRDTVTGVTAIVANREFDRGDIIDSKVIELTYPLKIEHVVSRVSGLYGELARTVLEKISRNGRLLGSPQDESKASYSVWRDEEDYRINWENSAEAIVHFIGCLSFPYKGASTIYDGRLIRILEAKAEADVEVANRNVGKVLFMVENKPVVICGSGLLRIEAAVDDNGQSVLPFKSFRTRLK